jgi:hypothetical protein
VCCWLIRGVGAGVGAVVVGVCVRCGHLRCVSAVKVAVRVNKFSEILAVDNQHIGASEMLGTVALGSRRATIW